MSFISAMDHQISIVSAALLIGLSQLVAAEELTQEPHQFDLGNVLAIIVLLVMGILGGLACLGSYARNHLRNSY